jgi:hypothetical protein
MCVLSCFNLIEAYNNGITWEFTESHDISDLTRNIATEGHRDRPKVVINSCDHGRGSFIGAFRSIDRFTTPRTSNSSNGFRSRKIRVASSKMGTNSRGNSTPYTSPSLTARVRAHDNSTDNDPLSLMCRPVPTSAPQGLAFTPGHAVGKRVEGGIAGC